MLANKISPTNALKYARIARSTGKSLRASSAFYAWRWAKRSKVQDDAKNGV